MADASLQIVCFHGTLQRPRVWTSFLDEILPQLKDYAPIVHCPDLYEDAPHDLEQWLIEQAAKIDPELPLVIIGYSLGGRLALGLQDILKHPRCALVLFSTDPGEHDADQRRAIRQRDADWTERFRSLGWDEMMRTWSELSVFSGRENPVPPVESDFDRETLSRIWDATSKGRMPSYQHAKTLLETPTLVITGELDVKFTEIAHTKLAYAKRAVVDDAGHRLPWEKMSYCQMKVLDFLNPIIASF